MSLKRLVVTMGDPLGIGPEIIVKALSELVLEKTHVTVVGASSAFQNLKKAQKVFSQKNTQFISVVNKNTILTSKQAGELSFKALEVAVQLIRDGSAQALVTAPISKEHIKLSGFQFPGHTEYLCDEFNVKKFAMMLFHDRLRVVLTTIHEPLKNVPSLTTQKNILEKLTLTETCLRDSFGIKKPRIAVCGLNPHAGENGLIGDEEKKIIVPAIKKFIQKFGNEKSVVAGPVSADTVFYQALNGHYDAVLCHYHDQGLIPLKVTGFDSGVNLTLGLPFIRTSPDHGTAFDIAGKGIADASSMKAAMRAAQKFL